MFQPVLRRPLPGRAAPPLLAAVGPWLPTGAGTSAVRNALYFSGHALAWPLAVLVGHAAVGGVLVLLLPDPRQEAAA